MAGLVGCVVASGAIIASVCIVTACGDEQPVAGTLPPIVTTTTTTTLPATTTTVQRYYEVQGGDTLFKIAERFGVSMEALIAINGITNPDKIEAGQQIEIPPVVPSADPAVASSTSSTFVGITSPPVTASSTTTSTP